MQPVPRKIEHADQNQLALLIAQDIFAGFNHHFKIFQDISQNAKILFEEQDWAQAQKESKERIYFYDKRVSECINDLKSSYRLWPFKPGLWLEIKRQYVILLYDSQQPDLAETFYTSVFCRMFERKYFNNE